MKDQFRRRITNVVIGIGLVMTGLGMPGLRYDVSPSLHTGQLGFLLAVIGLLTGPPLKQGRLITWKESEILASFQDRQNNPERLDLPASPTGDRPA